ncbi:MAG: hypothetical protein JNK02_03060 [Planctomycetes bacterium]|nr:hypothetical protein [Planctomycetota bacterium]
MWIAERIRKALGELLDEDSAATASRELPATVDDERLLLLAELFGIEPEVLARRVSAFNRAHFEVRSTFCGLVLDGRDPAEWAAENRTTAERAKGSLRRALWILGVREEINLDKLLNSDDGGVDDES